MSDEYEYFEEEDFDTQFNGGTLRRILAQTLPYRRWIGGFLAMISIVAFLDAYFTFLSKRIVDEGIVAGNREIDLRKLAASLGEKKLKVARHDEAEKLTGLQVGGISALALLNKPFEVCLDRSALDLAQLYVSAGQRGLNVKIGVQDLVQLTKAKVVEATE